MTVEQGVEFFKKHQKLLLCLASLYVVSLLLFHIQFKDEYVWHIACLFSVLMNGTYVFEAYKQQAYLKPESIVAGSLISLSIMGILIHPLFVIIAIFGHGTWDLLKHRGAGIPFLSWYTLSCSLVDFTYGSVLTVFWVSGL